MWLSFALGAVGITGLVIASQKDARWRKFGWAFNLANQPLWVVFTVLNRQWGLLLLTAGYTFAYTRLLVRELRTAKTQQD